MWTMDFASAALGRTWERLRLALLAIREAEALGQDSTAMSYAWDLFGVPEIVQDAYFMRDLMESYYGAVRERDLPSFQLLLKNSTDLLRSLFNYVILSKMFFSRRVFCEYCGALRIVLHHPDMEGLPSPIPEEYAGIRFPGQEQYEEDHLRVYFDMLEDILEVSFKALDILRIPPAERPAPPPPASHPAVTTAALLHKVDDGATSEKNHAGSDAGDQESDTYLDLNLFPPQYHFDCERGRNGASTSRDPASNGTGNDVEVADPGNIHNGGLLRSMIAGGGYCPICGCSGLGYQGMHSTHAANAEGSDEADGAGSSGARTIKFI